MRAHKVYEFRRGQDVRSALDVGLWRDPVRIGIPIDINLHKIKKEGVTVDSKDLPTKEPDVIIRELYDTCPEFTDPPFDYRISQIKWKGDYILGSMQLSYGDYEVTVEVPRSQMEVFRAHAAKSYDLSQNTLLDSIYNIDEGYIKKQRRR